MDVHEKARKRRIDAPIWKKQLTKELLKPKRKKFRRRRVYAGSVDSIWTADLIDVHQYTRQNKGYKFILVVLDVFSRYAWARPLKNKTGKEVAMAIEDILQEDGRKPRKLWTDQGTEFYNVNVAHVLKTNKIELYSTHNEPKATIAERFIRTLREKIESNYLLTQSTVWYDILPELVREYNTSKHRITKMTPEDASLPENYDKVFTFKHTKDKNPPVFKVGDKVRISVHKSLFTKGATANWSEEIFQVRNVRTDTHPIVYELEDLAGEHVKGTFYKEQLQKTRQEIYRVDRIVRKRGNEVLVKWSGYPEKFNSWMPAEDIMKSGEAIQNIE